MSQIVLSDETAKKLLNLLGLGGDPQGKASGPGKALNRIAPFEITSGLEDGHYMGKRLFYDEEAGEYQIDGDEYEIYDPVGGEYSEGDRVFCAFRGRWEIVGSGGGSSEPKLAGIVMETFGPGEDGRVKIYGKTYPDKDEDGNPIEPVYDIIICDELAGAQNEHPEKLVKGTVLTDIRGPFSRDKVGGEPGEKEQVYKAVNTEGVYSGMLLSEVTGPDAESTIQIADSEDDLTTMTIHSYYLGEYQTIEAGTGVMVARQRTESGLRLVIVKSRSVITDTEPE